MELADKRTAEMFKAFCDENRIKIMKLLQGGEKCACVLLDDLHITQPTLSHHMKILDRKSTRLNSSQTGALPIYVKIIRKWY